MGSTMNRRHEDPQHTLLLQSYQRDTLTTNTPVQNDDSDSSHTLNNAPSPSPLPLPNKMRNTTIRSMVVSSHYSVMALGMILLLVLAVIAVTVVIKTPTINYDTKLRPGTAHTSDFDRISTSILPIVSHVDSVGGGGMVHDIDDETIPQTSFDDEKELHQQQQQQQHRVRMIRQQLFDMAQHIDGTIYFPPCRTETNSMPHSSMYDTVAMGWIQQRPSTTVTTTTISNTGSTLSSNDPRHHHHPTEHSSVSAFDPYSSNHHHCNDDDYSNTNPIGIVIIQVQNEYDVQVAVPILAHLYQTYQFPFRIRSGGHHKAGYSSLTDVRNSHNGDGAVLSLSLLNHLRIVPSSLPETNDRTTIQDEFTSIVIGPAVRVQDILQQVTYPYKYGGVIGFCSHVAEGGFVLGGGFGLQSRMYGLGLDSVISFRVVLYNGTVMTTSSTHKSDLHWALLGAGSGSYGVITEMEYQIHPVSDILHTLQIKFHDLSNLAYFLYQIGRMESTLPDNVILMYDAMNAVSLLWTGSDDAEVEEGNDKLLKLVESILGSSSKRNLFDTNQVTISWTDTFSTTNYSIQSSNNTDYVDWGATAWAAACWTGFLFPENNTIDIWNDIVHHIDVGLLSSHPYLYPDIELWGGDISRRASNATAFPYRSAVYNVGILLIIPLNEPNGTEVFERESKKINEWWYKVDQYLTGSYVNYPSVSLLDHTDPHHYARVLWGENLPRLVQIKQQFDPNHVFQFPMSVPNVL
jgi:FAD/FMN-containing dehydrogenase